MQSIRTLACLIGGLACFGSPARGQPTPNMPPDVVNLTACPLGPDGFTVNGRIHPHGQPATWFIEYGPTAAYGMKTEARPLPPRLAAFYRESWDDNLGGWLGGLNAQLLKHHKEGGAL